MTILPLNPADQSSPDALRAFLAQCREAARRDGRAKLVSISLAVDALDPLAVLESIFEPGELHFYAERPGLASALAGAEAVLLHEARGPDRFASVQRFIDDTLAHTIAVGDVAAPFGGPHFFTSFAFLDEVEPGEPFPAARVFVPRWQVARAGDVTTAVANLLVTPDADLDGLTARVWRAHGKFRNFEFRDPGGTGILPVSLLEKAHGQDAHATQEFHIRQGAYLPHWTREGAIYSVTFRLADSVPAPVLEAWRLERADLETAARRPARPLTANEYEKLISLHSEKIEAYLDSGAGACYLRMTEVAMIVSAALRHFDGERYELHDWCVMPNHVHVILRPLVGHTLENILHSWKSYTATAANRLLGRGGEFWQPEYYDHLIRDEADYHHAVDYVRRNPEKAGLRDWKWIGRGTGNTPGGTGILPVSLLEKTHGQDAHATQSRGPDARCATFDCREAGDYRAAVTRGLECIAAGEFQKIVLARAQDVSASQPFHPLRVLNGLRQRFPDCYSFSLADGAGHSFIGASPERLARVSQGVLETEALAGSAPRGPGASEDAALAAALLHSEKDLREQRLVLDSIVRRLAPLGLTLEFPSRPGVRRLANVQHLHTPVRAPLPDGVRLLDAVARLHPTPAVGGTPRAAAVPRIRGLEGFPRGLYAGALGWVNARGGGEFFVGIRSALVAGATARVYAGAGIVAGSTPERELAETALKFHALLDALLA